MNRHVRERARRSLLTGLAGLLLLSGRAFPAPEGGAASGSEEEAALRISTLFSAQDVRDNLSTPEKRSQATEWCRRHGITRVFIETFRDGYRADRETLAASKAHFLAEGFAVSGCITPTRVGKASTGWRGISCYTNEGTRKEIQGIFEFTAGLFDEIMIDDFLFCDCACNECKEAKGERSWSDYRCALMLDVSRRRILEPSRRVNPKVRAIIKYPQWYDDFHNRGYDVAAETALFPLIWVGTETRDPDNRRWGRKAQYEAYFIMRWLGSIGQEKTGGGWFDPFGTSPPTYLEQARQTVLGGAREMLLFCYNALIRAEHRANPEALRSEIPALEMLAGWVQGKTPVGVLAVKPPNSQPGQGEEYIFDFVGMLGIPLVPATRVDPKAPALLVTSHILNTPEDREAVEAYIRSGRPVLLSPAASRTLADVKPATSDQVQKISWKDDPRELLGLDQDRLDRLRKPLLAPVCEFEAPGKVALYLLDPGIRAVENFNDRPVHFRYREGRGDVEILERMGLPAGADAGVRCDEGVVAGEIPPRSLVVLKIPPRKR